MAAVHFCLLLALGWCSPRIHAWLPTISTTTGPVRTTRRRHQQSARDAATTSSGSSKRRRKQNKYANFSKVKQDADPFDELLAESQQKQAALEQDKVNAAKPQNKIPVAPQGVEPVISPRTASLFPQEHMNPYDPATFGYIEIGHVTGAHGVHGWIKVTSTTDFPVERLCTAGAVRHLKLAHKRAPRAVTVVTGKHRVHDEYLLYLQDVTDRDAAAKLRGATLYVRQEDKVIMPRASATECGGEEPQQEYIVSDLIDMQVHDQRTNHLVGKISGVVLADDMCSVPGLGQDLLQVTLHKGTSSSSSSSSSWTADELVLIPLVPQIVPTVNMTTRQIWIDPPAGLLDLTYVREERVRVKGFLPPSWDGEAEGETTED